MNCCCSQLSHLLLHNHLLNVPLLSRICLFVSPFLSPTVCLCALKCLLICIPAGRRSTVLYVRCLVKQVHLSVYYILNGKFIQNDALSYWWELKFSLNAVQVLNRQYPSFFFTDDHPDCPQCISHMTVVILLGSESAPKPSQRRLAKEKYRVGDSLSTRAFPSSCSFSQWCSAICSTVTWVTPKRHHWLCYH